MYSTGFCFGGWWVIPIIMIIFCAAICFFFRRRNSGICCSDYPDRQEGRKNSESPLEVLKKRYANGEITSEEYEKIKRDIQG